jgi:hypothetical protein
VIKLLGSEINLILFDMDYMTILIAVFAAIIYSLVFYAKALVKDGDKFDPVKFFSTLIVGAAIGIALSLAKNPFSQEALEAQLAIYASTIALVETILKIVWEAVKSGVAKREPIETIPATPT